jgi:hypothetical protein
LDDALLVREAAVAHGRVVRIQFLNLDPLDRGVESIATVQHQLAGALHAAEAVGGRDDGIAALRAEMHEGCSGYGCEARSQRDARGEPRCSPEKMASGE